jgi:hypothetical protein
MLGCPQEEGGAMFEVDGSIIRARGKKHQFSDIIVETIDFDDVVVIRLAGDSSKRNNRNVYAVDLNAKVLWQIPERRHLQDHSPYVGLYRSGHLVEAFNWDGSLLKLDPKRGTVHNEGFIAYEPHHRRPRPTRSMM